MVVSINALEVASELAHARVVEFFLTNDNTPVDSEMLSEEQENIIYTTQQNGERIYTEEAQDKFNIYYDFYFETITNHQLIPKRKV